MNRLTKLGITLGIAGMLFAPALSYAQSIGTSTKTIGYFYSISGTMIDAEDNSGAMSSYLTRGIRYNGTGETFAVSNIKDVTGLVDADGNVLNKYTYTAYGVPTSYSSTSVNSKLNTQNSTLSISSNPYTYSNYYTDSESGNYYLNARYYDPTLGVFLTSDTYNLPNRNMYVKGNPVMGVDPFGHIEVNVEELLKTHKVTANFDGKSKEIKSENEWNQFAQHKGLKDFKFDFSGENINTLEKASFTFDGKGNNYTPKERTETYTGKTKITTQWNQISQNFISNNLNIEIEKNQAVDNNEQFLEIDNHLFHISAVENAFTSKNIKFNKNSLETEIRSMSEHELDIFSKININDAFIRNMSAVYGENEVQFDKKSLLANKAMVIKL